MKVILLKDVLGKGSKNDIIDVSSGYANNYLIKNGLAVMYTESSNKKLLTELDKKRVEEEENIKKYKKIKASLEKEILTFKVKAGENDKIFGSISAKQISDELKVKGYEIDKKKIIITGSIDRLGVHSVKIKLHKEVEFLLNIMLTK